MTPLKLINVEDENKLLAEEKTKKRKQKENSLYYKTGVLIDNFFSSFNIFYILGACILAFIWIAFIDTTEHINKTDVETIYYHGTDKRGKSEYSFLSYNEEYKAITSTRVPTSEDTKVLIFNDVKGTDKNWIEYKMLLSNLDVSYSNDNYIHIHVKDPSDIKGSK